MNQDTSEAARLDGCRFTHGAGAVVRKPFGEDVPLTMHELSAGGSAYAGQFGFIPFTAALRLPRHVHLAGEGAECRFVAERILVLNGVALVELSGAVVVVAPGTLVEIGHGVPHTWTACPAGVRLPDESVSDGTFLMVYQYAEATAFSPHAGTDRLATAADYTRFAGDLDAIRFPRMTPGEVVHGAILAWNGGWAEPRPAG